MSKELIRIAKKVAKQEDLIYAPDEAALMWMNEFAKIVKLREREMCAQVCERLGLPDVAALIRQRIDSDSQE
jgi:hypothetical protein